MIFGVEKDYFLFAIALIWIVFATVQDIRKREVADWLNFSLIAFALAYRAFYSSFSGDWNFLGWGIVGFVVFFGLANLFYYSGVFAGGDAKLLMGLGVVLPMSSFADIVIIGLGFVFLLFFVGAIYSLIYSVFIVRRNYSKFKPEFYKNLGKKRNWLLTLGFAVLFVIAIYNLTGANVVFLGIGVLFSIFVFLLMTYAKSLEVCMIKLVSPSKLTEGDWLVSSIWVGKTLIKKTVHGLTKEDIIKLKKNGKKVLIKDGIPFVPAFLLSFLIMVFFLAVSRYQIESLISLLS